MNDAELMDESPCIYTIYISTEYRWKLFSFDSFHKRIEVNSPFSLSWQDSVIIMFIRPVYSKR